MKQEARIKNKNIFQKTMIHDSLFMIRKSKGFTLIELLVVIVIIGVLTALILANFVGIRQRSRDGQRKADMRQIQAALELYRSDEGSYPNDGSFSCTGTDTSLTFGTSPNTTTYLQKVPCDPLDDPQKDYAYTPTAGGGYTLVGCLENDKDGQLDNPVVACDGFSNRWKLTYKNP